MCMSVSDERAVDMGKDCGIRRGEREDDLAWPSVGGCAVAGLREKGIGIAKV